MAFARFLLAVMGQPVLRVAESGEEVMPAGKPLAVLSYLALREQPASRDHLAGFFWPDVPSERARASLRQAFWTLRKVLGERVVEEDGEELGLVPGLVDSDLHALERRVEDGDALGALALWKGPPFQQFPLSSVPEWDRWTEEVRIISENRLARALARSAEEARSEGRLEAALEMLEGTVHVQPDRAGHGLALLGAQLELRRFEEGEALLSQLRAAFGEDEAIALELMEWEDQLRALRSGGSPDDQEADPSRFIGRGEEFARLLLLWETVRAGHGARAVVLGEEGSGKTRLLGELVPAVEDRQGRVVVLRPEPGEADVEWTLVSELIRALSSLSGAAGISRYSMEVLRLLVPTLGAGSGGTEPVDPRIAGEHGLFGSALVEALRDLVGAVSEDHPLLLVIDDLDRGDPNSRRALSALWRRHPDAPALVVISARADPGLPSSPEASRLELGPWSLAEVLEALAAYIGARSDDEALQEAAGLIRPTAHGNPRATLGLLEHFVKAGAIERREPDAWRFHRRRARKAIASWSEERTADRLSRDRTAWTAAAVTALLLLAAVPVLLLGRPGSERTPRYGGGVIFLPSAGEMLEIHPSAAPPAEWEVRPSQSFHPTGPRVRGPFRGPDGGLLWFERLGEGDERPWIRQASPDGPGEITIRTGGDVSLTDVSPEGRRILYNTQDPWNPEYTTHLWMLDTRTGTHHRLYAAFERVGGSTWSPRGDRIALLIQGTPDTLAILRPNGSELVRRAIAGLGAVGWCGDDRLVSTIQEGTTRRLVLIDPTTLRHRFLPEDDFVATAPSCSPDAEAALYGVARDLHVELRLLDLRSGETWELPYEPTWRNLRFQWLPDEPRAVPDRLEVTGPPGPLSWGDRALLEARLIHSDGSAPKADVEWRTEDASVAWVSPEGVLYANGVGRSRIEATWDGWLADSLTVEVGGEADRGTLLSDRFEELDPERWIPVGYPSPRAAVLEGEPVLELLGDGIYEDGILLREGLPGDHGITLEAEVRLRFTRRDRQRVRICLFDGEVPEPEEDRAPEIFELRDRQMPCVLYPTGELAFQDTTRLQVRIHPSPVIGRVDVSQHLPFSRWTHLALQVRVDGSLEVFVNREPVYTSSVRLLRDPPPRWRVLLLGSAVDTRVFVRNVAVWPGLRYGRD